MTAFTAKQVVSFLDNAAARADIVNRIPATSKQCWYLASLIAKDNDETTYNDVTSPQFVLTKKRASQMIGWYL